MRILHYFLGFDRAGGLNRYAADLAAEQVCSGHQVFALYPVGSMRKTSAILPAGTCRGVRKYKLLGGRPVPLLLGVREPERVTGFSGRLSPEAVRNFCDEIRTEILHVHTWMGFPDELLPELKKRGVKVVFTSHDYFGFCPKVNFVDHLGQVCGQPGDRRCSECNAAAPSDWELAMRNNPILLMMKGILRPLADILRRRHGTKKNVSLRNYGEWRKYYEELWCQCDVIHCNSDVTAGIYRRFLPEAKIEVTPITHGGIVDRRARKNVHDILEFTFSGPPEAFKGLPSLVKVLTEMYRDGIRNWHLHVWGHRGNYDCPAITCHGRYNAAQKAEVFERSDLLIVPSICRETFGFVVPEALMYGTPVLCSDTVGAKSLVAPEMIYHGEAELREKLEFFCRHPHELERVNQEICSAEFPLNIQMHTNIIMDLYSNIRV